MNSFKWFTCIGGLIAVAVGCGGQTQEESSKTEFASHQALPAEVSTEVSPTQEDQYFNAPPERFTPREHTPKYRQTDPTPPNVNALPKLVMRMEKCFPKPVSRRKTAAIATGGLGAGVSKKKSRASKKGRASSGPLPKSAGKRMKEAPVAQAPAPVPATSPAPADRGRAVAAEESAAPVPAASTYAEKEDAVGVADKASAEELSKMAKKRRVPAQIAVDDEALAEQQPDPDDQYDDWGSATYLSNDDTMSLSSAQRVIYAIDNFLPLPAEHIRPHELLNYFQFTTTPVADGHDFSVFGDMAPDPDQSGIYNLGLAVKGRPVDKKSRRNAALTLVIDRSGSMSDEGRMNYLKRGLMQMLNQLKTGDMLHVVLFDHNVCVPAENFVVGRDDMQKIKDLINVLKPQGSTDLHAGLKTGYDIADRSYQEKFTNRVVMITDALTNTGVTNEEMISMISKYYDTRRIRLSGIGVGRSFNDALLDRLTERGKGAYVFLGSEMEVDAVFGSRFISLIETTALDVHFRLHLPKSLRLDVFYGEESSTVKTDVQEIHYFANTSQLFFSDLMARKGRVRPKDGIMLTIEYKDPETEQPLVEEYAFILEALLSRSENVKKARVIMTFIDLLTELANRPSPGAWGRAAGSWQDSGGWERCESGQQKLVQLSVGIDHDPEVARVKELLTKYCARYERPRNPVRRKIAAPDDGWPGAKSNR